MAKKSTGRKSTTKSGTRGKKRVAARSTTKRRTTATKSKSARPAKRAARGKVGGDRNVARKFGSRGDFGVPASKLAVAREVSEEAKHRPGGDHTVDDRQPRSGVDSADSGVGARDAGPGSASGGDLDASFTGLSSSASEDEIRPDAVDDAR